MLYIRGLVCTADPPDVDRWPEEQRDAALQNKQLSPNSAKRLVAKFQKCVSIGGQPPRDPLALGPIADGCTLESRLLAALAQLEEIKSKLSEKPIPKMLKGMLEVQSPAFHGLP